MQENAYTPAKPLVFIQIRDLQIGNFFDKISPIMIMGQDVAILLKLSLEKTSRILSKKLAADLLLPPSEVTKSLSRLKASGLVSLSDFEKRVNRAALLEFLLHGLKYVFPVKRGELTRGIPTASAAEPLKAYFEAGGDPPPVWPYIEGTTRGYSFEPIYKHAPEAALRDPRLYELLALSDAIRGERARERALAIDELTKRLMNHG